MSKSQILNFTPGQVLFSEGDETSEMYIVTKGNVQILKKADDNRKILLAELGPGTMIGEMSLITGRPRSATAMAVNPVEVKVITKKIFDHSSAGIPDWAISIAKVLIERLRHINQVIKKNVTFDEYQKQEDEKLDYTTDFSIEYKHEINPEFVYLKGYFFKNDVEKLQAFINKLIRQKISAITLDFSEVIDIDNHSINFLNNITKRFNQGTTKFSIQNIQLIYTKIGTSKAISNVVQTLTPPRKNILSGDYLIKQGSSSKEMYVIKEGRFKVSRNVNDEEIYFAEISSGDVVGEMSLFAGGKRSASVKAIKPGIVYEIKEKDIKNNRYNIPEWFLRIIQQLINRIRLSDAKFDDIIKKKKDIFQELDVHIDYIPDKSKSGIFKLKGKLIERNINYFKNHLVKLINSGFLFIVLDFSNVNEIDESFVPLFRELSSILRTKGGKLHFINTQKRMETIFRETVVTKKGLVNKDQGVSSYSFREISEEHDSLTGLYKNKFFLKYLTEELERCYRYKSILSLLLFNIDGFHKPTTKVDERRNKYILEQIGKIIIERFRKVDYCFSNSNGEFKIILPGTENVNALLICKEMQSLFSRTDFSFDNTTFKITCCYGVTSSRKTDKTDDILKRAIAALNKAKKIGFNHIEN